MLLEPLFDIYDFNKQQINNELLEIKIEAAKKNYSTELLDLIKLMLISD